MQTETLYRLALEFAQLRGDELVCDLYCGAGTISLMLARHCRQVLGVEIVPQAIENAKANALHNGIGNVDFHCAPAEELLPRLVERGLRPQVMVVDPPRKGLEPAVIDAMAQAAPERIVYVSCNPATLATGRSPALPARLHPGKGAESVDMFCWTSGIETVAPICPVAGIIPLVWSTAATHSCIFWESFFQFARILKKPLLFWLNLFHVSTR